MKQYTRHKSPDEIIAQCQAAGIDIDASKHDAGGDHLVVSLPGPTGESVPVLFNTFSGRFFYAPASGEAFSSDQNRDTEPWFAAMLDFFYMDAVPA